MPRLQSRRPERLPRECSVVLPLTAASNRILLRHCYWPRFTDTMDSSAVAVDGARCGASPSLKATSEDAPLSQDAAITR